MVFSWSLGGVGLIYNANMSFFILPVIVPFCGVSVQALVFLNSFLYSPSSLSLSIPLLSLPFPFFKTALKN
jgi:hypothetical protein